MDGCAVDSALTDPITVDGDGGAGAGEEIETAQCLNDDTCTLEAVSDTCVLCHLCVMRY